MTKLEIKQDTAAPVREGFRRDINLERKLGLIISDALDGKISIQQLYREYGQFRDWISDSYPQFWDEEFSNLLLKEIYEAVSLLHDDFTCEDYTDRPEDLVEFRDQLLGRKEFRTLIEYNGDTCRVTYLPYARTVPSNGSTKDDVTIERI